MKIIDKQTLRIPLILTAVLLFFASSIYLFFSIFREQEFYSYLKSSAIARAKLIIDAGVKPEQFNSIDIDLKDSPYLLNQYIIYDSSGNILYQSKNAVPHLTASYKKILPKNSINFENDGFERTIFSNNENTHHRTLILEGAGYDKAGFNKQKSLLINLIVASSILILLIILISRFYIKKDLKPLGKIADRMRKISSKNLHDRLPEAKLKNEIGQMATTFNSLLDRLETTYLEQLNFVSYVSHELRTPLAILLGNAQVTLMKDRNTAEYKETIKEFLVDINSMTDLTNNLLELARLNASSQSIDFRKIRIDDILFRASDLLIKKKPEYKIKIEFAEIHENEDLLHLDGNAELLILAMRNLLDNGCKYSENHTIDVKISTKPHLIIIQFIDEGIGISKEEQHHIFEPYYRSQKSQNISGHGIGLPLTKRIIDIHLGNINILSSLAIGSTFIIELPNSK